jgi:putative PIN family toxin of toxin-antitoxin system
MRVLLDTNVLISYLLAPAGDSPVVDVVEGGIFGRYALLLPQDLLEELVPKTRSKPYLAERIAPEQVQALVELLADVAEVIPRITQPIPAIGRDRSDDYLLAYAVVGRADYLVTGDRDLLVLGQVAETRIVSPSTFAALEG